MAVRTEVSDKWVRAFVGETAVLESRAPVLFWEEAFPVPGYAFAREDVRTDLLRPASGEPPRQPFFFLPKGPVAEWYDLEVDGRVVPNVAWSRDEAELRDLLILSWQPGLIDRWMEEDELVVGHPRDPHKRVEALVSTRHVTVAVDGRTLADTYSPVLLFETGAPTRYYVPERDVNFSALRPSANVSVCPYKGVADRYWHVQGEPEVLNAGWSYSSPFPAVGKIAGMVSFYNELVDITVDGVSGPRPVTIFSDPANRPTTEGR